MSHPIEIDIWSGDWGLPSIDISCLQVMAYCKFSGVPFVTRIRSPFQRTLPTFHQGNSTFSNLQDIAAYLKSKKFNSDNFLTPKDLSEVRAYSELLKDKLYPALQFIWWVDKKNNIRLTRPWYGKRLSFPFNYYYPGQYEASAKDLLTSIYGSVEDDYMVVETQVYTDAEKCLTLLSNKLGSSKYFLGALPSSLDAIVFSYLAPLLKAPFPNPALQNHLKACKNLVSFVDSILEKYFPEVMKEYEKRNREIQKAEAEERFPYKSRHQILAIFIAFAAMFGYISIAQSFIRKGIVMENSFYEAEEERD